jgi:hypothetical protein
MADLISPVPLMTEVVQQTALAFSDVFDVDLVWKDNLGGEGIA